MGALLLLLLGRLAGKDLLLVALALEARIAAAPQGQLSAVEVEDLLRDVIEQIAVMADDENRRRAGLQIVGEPQHAFEVEIVRRLVEQQDVGLREQHRGERHAHPPAAGKFSERAALRGLVEAEPFEDPRRPRRGVMRFDVDEARVDVGDALGIVRGFRFRHQRLALDVGGEHEVDEAFGAGRGFLVDAADARALGDHDRAGLRPELAAENAKERGLAGAVPPDKADMRARGQRSGRVVDQETLAEAIGEGADVQHGRAFRAARSLWQGQAAGADQMRGGVSSPERQRRSEARRTATGKLANRMAMRSDRPGGRSTRSAPGRRLSLLAVRKILN